MSEEAKISGILKSGEFAKFVNLPPATIRDILTQKGVDYSKGYRVRECIPALIEFYRKVREGHDPKAVENRNAIRENERALSDLELARKRSEFFPADHTLNVFADLSTKWRVTVEGASYIPEPLRQRLLLELSQVKPMDFVHAE